MKFILPFILITTFLSCRPKGHFLVVNESESKKKVDIKILIGGEEIFSDIVYSCGSKTDNQYSFEKAIEKGKRTITVIADSGKLKVTKPIMMDKDKWISIQFFDKRASKLRGCYFDVVGLDEYSRKSSDGIEITVSGKL